MSDKKFTLDPEHLERLRALMREEEAKVDAQPTDEATLLRMERELQRTLRTLAEGKNNDRSAEERSARESQRHWQGIEAKLKGNETLDSKVVPLRAKRSMGVWFGALAAAAAALFVLMPRQAQDSGSGDIDQFAIKGSAGLAWPADCELKVIEAPEVNPSADATAYEGPIGASFQLALRCDKSGFLNLRIDGPEAVLVRNFRVTAGETEAIIPDGKVQSFTLRAEAPWVISSVVTSSALPENGILPSTDAEAENLKALWFDRITVKGAK